MQDLNLHIFKNNRERAEAREALPALTQHPGWKFLIRVFDLNIQALDEQLRVREDFKNLDEVYRLQDRLADLESFNDLPATILEDLQISDDLPDDDAYDPPPAST